MSDYTFVDGGAPSPSNISVFIRARPPQNKSATLSFLEYENSPDTERGAITIREPGENPKKYGEVKFQFDRIFWTDTLQEEVFNTVCRPQIEHVLNGFNACCFAYGQTGSGKAK